MKTGICMLMLLISHSITAQKQTYKFESVQDSIKYYEYETVLQNAWLGNTKVDLKSIDKDSVARSFKEIRALMASIPKYKYLQYAASYSKLDEVINSTRKDTVHYVSMTGREYKKIPLKILQFKNLQEIELISTQVKKIPWLLNWSIFGIDSLRTIKVYNHRSKRSLKFTKNTTIRKLVYRENPYAPEPKNLHKLANVKELDLVRNDFNRMRDLRLSKLKKLYELNLSHNNLEISELAEDTVYTLSNLILSFNQLSGVPKEIGYFKNLKELQLGENNILSEYIHPALGSLRQLETLSFYKNQLDSLPDFLFQLPNLKELDLYYNQVQIIPAAISKLENLEKLYLAYNRIYTIPETIGKLQKLTEMYLHHNRLSYLPASICSLENMTDFHIHSNYFNAFPTCILSFKKLEDLDISFNDIHYIPEAIKELKALKYLWMRGIVFDAQSKAQAEALQSTFDALQKRGVKISIESE